MASGLAASTNTGTTTGTNTGTTVTNTRTTGMTGLTTQPIGIVIGAAGKATVTWMAGTATLPKGTMITTTTGTTEGVHQGALNRRPRVSDNVTAHSVGERTAMSLVTSLQILTAILAFIAGVRWYQAATVQTPDFGVIGVYGPQPEISNWATVSANRNRAAALWSCAAAVAGALSSFVAAM